MAGLLDVHVHRGAVVGLSDREMAIVINDLRHRRTDYTGMRNLSDRLNCAEEREKWAKEILEPDLVRIKLGDTMDEETEP